jgi:hypothetical protein
MSHRHPTISKKIDFILEQSQDKQATTNYTTMSSSTKSAMMVLINAFKTRYGMSPNDLQVLMEIAEQAKSVVSAHAQTMEEYNALQEEYQLEKTISTVQLYKIAIMNVLGMPFDDENSLTEVEQMEEVFHKFLTENPDAEIPECWASMKLGKWWDRRVKKVAKGEFLTPEYRVPVAEAFGSQFEGFATNFDALIADSKAYKTAIKPDPKTGGAVATKKPIKNTERSPSPVPVARPKKATPASKPVVIGEFEYDLADKGFNPRGFKKYEHLTAGFFKTHYTYEIQDKLAVPTAETKCCARMVLDGAGTAYPKIRMPFWANKDEVGVSPCDELFTFRFPTDLLAPTFLQDFITQIRIQKEKGEGVIYWDEQGFLDAFIAPNEQYWSASCPDWAEKLGLQVEEVDAEEVEECD